MQEAKLSTRAEAQAEAERRFATEPIFAYQPEFVRSFVWGAEWRDAQEEARYAGLIACAYGLIENMSFHHETEGWVTTFQDKPRAVHALGGIKAWLETLEGEARHTLQDEGEDKGGG